jgi:hypothetical protein
MGLGIITLFFLVSFTLLYVSKTLSNKPEWVTKAADKVASNIDVLAFWGLIYSVVAIVLSPLAVWGRFALLIVFLSNIVLFLLTLPYMLDHLVAKYPDKIPAPIVHELKNLVAAVMAREKIAGYIGAAFSFLLFIVLFR